MICGASSVRSDGLIFSEGTSTYNALTRAAEGGEEYISLCNPLGSARRTSVLTRPRRDGERNRREIPMLAQESLFRSVSAPLFWRFQAADARGCSPGTSRSSRRRDGRAYVPRPRTRLTKPELNLSRAFVDPLVRRPPC